MHYDYQYGFATNCLGCWWLPIRDDKIHRSFMSSKILSIHLYEKEIKTHIVSSRMITHISILPIILLQKQNNIFLSIILKEIYALLILASAS